MRVAAIYDIHGNLPALEAVLQEIRAAEVDQIVVGGDVVPGPLPRETIECLLKLDLPAQFILGNGEVAVCEQMSDRNPAAVPEQFRPIILWTAEQLDAKYQRLFASWPKTLQLEIACLGQVLFCHGTPRDENEIFTRLTPEERLAPMFEGVNAPVVICGHTHMQFDRAACGIRIVNAGSVGMPFGKTGADWLLLGDETGIELRHTDYDLAAAAKRIRSTNYIQAEEFAARYILSPPSEEQMLGLYERVAPASAR